MMRGIVMAVILLAAGALAVSWFIPLFGFSLQAYFVKPFRYAGTIEVTKVDVPARVASVISAVTVQEGDSVQEGQVVVRLACEDLRIAAERVQGDFERVTLLRRANAASAEEEAHIKAARDDAILRVGWCDVAAPLTGTVLTRYHEPGEQVAPGSKLLTLADLRQVWAYVYVPQPLLAQLRIGMELTGRLPELQDRALPGRVIKINDEAEFTPKNVQTREERTRLVYGVKVRFQNPNGLLKAGMPIEVALPEAARKD
jgi:HlyD family secretion protein